MTVDVIVGRLAIRLCTVFLILKGQKVMVIEQYNLLPNLLSTFIIFHQVFEGLHSQGQQTEVRDWVLLSLGSFIQRYVVSLDVNITLSECYLQPV